MTLDPWMCTLPIVAEDLIQNLKLGSHILINEPLCLRVHDPAYLLPILSFLKQDPKHQYHQLIDVCGVDTPQSTLRFNVVYHLLSLHHNQRIRIKVATDEKTPVPSVTSVFPAAGWWEREAYDMYGIRFENHPDLRRILTDYGFEGYPLRKDFPLSGFSQVRYDQAAQTIVSEPVHLPQPYRHFDHVSPWGGCLDRHKSES